MQRIQANLIDIPNCDIVGVELVFDNGLIQSITKTGKTYDHFLLPGFIDAHVHIESSLLVPSEFARMAVLHGTVATVSDPHEIANVCGMEGINFMIDNASKVPFHFFFGAPSCVPATVFETAGAQITAEDIRALLQRDDILYLTEMMNYPGVLHEDPAVMKKIQIALSAGKPVDGHAPGLRGKEAQKYIAAGISTDHECFTLEEALDKIEMGMKILIREGSAARNFDALIPLLKNHHSQLMFCSDDKHPDSLIKGHINELVARAVKLGYDLFHTLQVACINPVHHYKLPVGLLNVGDLADFILVHNLQDFKVYQTYIKGQLVAENGQSHISSVPLTAVNQFNCLPKKVADFKYQPHPTEQVIECLDGQLITNALPTPAAECVAENDILKLVVVNRYAEKPIAIAYIKNMGLKRGAIAGSVAHDSHNIVAVGVDDESLCKAVNLIIAQQGGLSAVDGSIEEVLPLPVAGLMSDADAWKVEQQYTRLDKMAKEMGSQLRAPYMSLSFMALLVIPHLKLSDKGLFDGNTFRFVYS